MIPPPRWFPGLRRLNPSGPAVAPYPRFGLNSPNESCSSQPALAIHDSALARLSSSGRVLVGALKQCVEPHPVVAERVAAPTIQPL